MSGGFIAAILLPPSCSSRGTQSSFLNQCRVISSLGGLQFICVYFNCKMYSVRDPVLAHLEVNPTVFDGASSWASTAAQVSSRIMLCSSHTISLPDAML